MESLSCTPQPSLSHELRALINKRNILTAKSKARVLNALDRQIEENKRRSQMDLRSKVIDEIFTSEESYIHQLELIIKFFKKPLDSSSLISPPARRALFGNIECIYQVNGELVQQLKTQGSNVGAAFLHLAPFFKLYSMYAYNYKSALALLEDLSKNDTKLSLWIRSQETRPEVGKKLSALLIAPIQRLPRYRMLLRQVLGLTPSTHPHYAIIADAVKEVEIATSHINGLVLQHETHARLVILQQCLVNSKPSIVAPNKRLLKEGVLMKMSANGQKAQRRYFILLSDSIVYCKLTCKDSEKSPSEPGSLQCCCVLPISKCSIESVLGQAVFNLSCRSETYILFSEHRDEALEWVDHIKAAISQYQENLMTLRKKSSSRHPLHLTKKRKYGKENNKLKDDERPSKKPKLTLRHGEEQENDVTETRKEIKSSIPLQGETQRTGYVQTIKSLFQAFGDSVRQYLYPLAAR